MGYDINLKAKLEGMDKWVMVGEEWIYLPRGASNVVKEVCGAYPSEWAGRKCSELYPILMQGASLLNLYPGKYASLLPGEKASRITIGMIRDTLTRIADCCSDYPSAVLEVDY